MLDHNLKRFFILIVSTLLLLDVATAKSTTISVELSDGSRVSKVKVIQRKQQDVELSILGLTVGRSKLSDVKGVFGGGEVYHEGDAGNSLYVLCYAGMDGSVITFESGEMGGSEHVISSAGLFGAEAQYRLKKICTKSSKVNLGLNIGEVRVGMSKDLVKKILGSPSKEQSKLLLYQYQVAEQRPKGGADVSSSFEIHFVAGKVSHLSASRVESY
ncbi:hypothetical protein AZI86_00070 [Bdellovibrio bacteriovorus]|uniref:Uncharacterized protein n=1 Tax=Bdellovibrio bacteriovorus TaxID=959 RepID=A0A150WM33_BDEBC|nr:hypothetical protein [Bdellovibrio bacteriovorus]KYG65512.1 hypothetical protein AZI86_00070 [Bdellovibrio bacteriovorus]